jgi:NAD(P)-dependent dehydrogenase (short-subunit alcohol dehydrogenase family)
MGTLDGKTAIVTGASRGIGRSIALRLAREGAQAVLCARNAEALDQAVHEIKQAGGEAFSLARDLRTPEAPVQLAAFALEKFRKIDIVVNNAGATKRGEFENLTEEDWADGFALKFFGTVRLTRAAWPHLKATSGSVVNISGIGGRTPGSQFTIWVRHEKITRVGEPEDVAALVAFMVSPEGSFLQGALIDIDGGATKTI